MTKQYGMAEAVEEMAKPLIANYHPELALARIKYIFVSEASKKNGRPVLGKARKVSGALEFLIESDFRLEIALDMWNMSSENQRNARVDHLLECCTGEEDEKTGDMKWKMRSADIQEFTSILRRHGAWNDDLSGMVEVAQRLNIEARVQEVADSLRN